MKKSIKIFIALIIVILAVVAYLFAINSNPVVNWAAKVTAQNISSMVVNRPQKRPISQYCAVDEADFAQVAQWISTAKIQKGDEETAPGMLEEDDYELTIVCNDGLIYRLTDLRDGGLYINEEYYVAKEGDPAALVNLLSSFQYGYSPDFMKEFDAFVQEKGLTEAQVEYLMNDKHYEKEDIVELTPELYFATFLPGNTVDGIGYEPDSTRDAALRGVGIDDEKHAVLANLGYSYNEMMNLTPLEFDLIFPNTDLLRQLEEHGFTVNDIKGFGNNDGKTYKELIAEMVEMEQYSDDLVSRLIEQGMTQVQIEILFARGYTENEVEILLAQSIDKVVAAALPGAPKNGETVEAPPQTEEFTAKLAEAGIDQDAYMTLLRMGYNQEQALGITKAEVEMIFPTNELLNKLVARGVSDEMIIDFLRHGNSFYYIIQRALGHL